MPSRKTVVIAAAVIALVAAAAVVVVRQLQVPAVVTASSSTDQRDPSALLTADDDATSTWSSDGEAVGAWLLVTWERPVTVDQVELRGAEGATTALLTLDDGATAQVAFDADGAAVVDLPARETSTARLTFATVDEEVDAVALGSLRIDDDGDEVPASPGDPDPTASSSDGPEAGALVDGDVIAGDLGEEWTAARDDDAPWVQLAWDGPRALSSVQIFGPSDDAVDPRATGGPRLAGTLRFSDGSSLVVSGIGGGDAPPTTIGFPTRVVDSVRLELEQTVPDSPTGLREFTVYGPDETPPDWSTGSLTYAVDVPDAGDCSNATDNVVASSGPGPRLLCPAPGSAVDGSASIAVAADPGTDLVATAWFPGAGSATEVGEATAGTDGRAVFEVDTTALARGPVSVQVSPASGLSEGAVPLSVQLMNRAGVEVTDAGHAPAGMTLQWDDEFEQPLSISGTGRTTTYAGAKPAAFGTAEFGDAVFADPDLGAENIAVVDGDYLRLRVLPTDGYDVATPYGQQHIGALLSSLAVGAAGFSAQYGYFEARMTGAPGLGTWPAFWMLNTQSATSDDATGGEVDAVELYGHEPTMTCHTLHDWGNPDAPEDQTTDPTCLSDTGISDWTSTWHTYAAQVTPNGAVFYVDGVEVRRDTSLQRSPEPFFFLVDLALGSGWPIDLTPTGGVTDLYVDWVRVHT